MAYWSFNNDYTERLNGWTMTTTSGSVGLTADRNLRANAALSVINGYIMTSSCPSPNTVMSAALWVYVIAAPSAYMCMFWWRQYTGGDTFFIGSAMGITLMNDGGSMRSSAAFSTNTWTHVGVTFDCVNVGCNANHYVNGNFLFAYALPYAMVTDYSGACYIGGASNGWIFNGYIDDLMAWNYQLSASQMMTVKNYYN